MSDLLKELERLVVEWRALAAAMWADDYRDPAIGDVYSDCADEIDAALAVFRRTAAAELTKMADDDGIPCDFALINEDGVAKWKKE